MALARYASAALCFVPNIAREPVTFEKVAYSTRIQWEPLLSRPPDQRLGTGRAIVRGHTWSSVFRASVTRLSTQNGTFWVPEKTQEARFMADVTIENGNRTVVITRLDRPVRGVAQKTPPSLQLAAS